MPWSFLGYHLKEIISSLRNINKQINSVYHLNLDLPLYLLLYTSVLKLTEQTEEECRAQKESSGKENCFGSEENISSLF